MLLGEVGRNAQKHGTMTGQSQAHRSGLGDHWRRPEPELRQYSRERGPLATVPFSGVRIMLFGIERYEYRVELNR